MAQPFGPDVIDAIAQVKSHGDALRDGDASARRALISTARFLITSLESPMEAMLRLMWAEPSHHAYLRVAVDLQLFKNMSANGGTAKSVNLLARLCGVDALLLARLMKHLAAMGTIREVSAEVYEHTALSMAMIEPPVYDAVTCCYDLIRPSYQKLPQYLAGRGYAMPQDPKDGVFQYAYGTGHTLFQYLAANPNEMIKFGSHMAGYSQGRPRWCQPGFYPVDERLGQGLQAGDDQVLLVDVGGGKGQDLLLFKKQFPHLHGRLVLQDLPEVIAEAKPNLENGFEAFGHNFTTPQPVKGARAYYLHSVLHDWSDDEGRRILQQIIPAMKKGYSKVLINECVIPDVQADPIMTGVDGNLMVLTASRERTKAQWDKLIESVGLKVSQTFTHPEAYESLIECELV